MVTTRIIVMLMLSLAMVSCVAALPGCEEQTVVESSTVTVKLGGKSFTLDLALTDETRFKGLSGRTEIPSEGGLMFVFPDRKVQMQAFVMRDCPVDIDIIYLDKSGRIVAMHEMKAEAPRSEAETPLQGGLNIPEWAKTNALYEERLKKYPSKYSSQFVIELKGGTIKTLTLKEGDKIELDIVGLKKRAK